MSLYRIRGDDNGEDDLRHSRYVPLEVWLNDLENERNVIISRLRHIDKVLVDNGRLRAETIPRRVR